MRGTSPGPRDGGAVSSPPGLAVTARDFGLKGPRGWVFQGVSVDAEPGSLIAVEGPSGSGRTCLLLALTGRMKATAGTATVGPAHLPKQLTAVRRLSAVANVAGVTDLEPALTVGEHLRERALLQRRFGDSLRGLMRPHRERTLEARLRIDAALGAAGLDREALPKGSRTVVRDLERLEALRLSVALALIGRPRLLGVDDVGLKLSDAERVEAWALLRSLADAGTTVVAVCSQAPDDAVVISTGTTNKAGTGTKAKSETEAEAGTQAEAETRAEADTDTDTDTDTTIDDGAKEDGDALAEAGRA
ncbi:ATP-binding cassette domain-containing protein [Streptomyces sp. HUAS TT20]|uniref:ATP-binding cassette domain-containing protein n=1 Tax=Streptomyces sp. HUAS TT20 TaxID=3447509 RepID=UPI0021D8EDE9|nr:ATP-binding cassette domain-containing protein [Streptomyces sp. HUAS 15-9]UXY27049.1 ATP-binding cassette domain-containing protein [Streptomyces sp. HUAS 15-9]